MRPSPISATRAKMRFAHRMNSANAAMTARLASSSPTVSAQRARQAIAFHAPQHDAAFAQEGIGSRGIARRRRRKMHQQKIADARRHLETKSGEFARQPVDPLLIVAYRLLDEIAIGDRADTRRKCRS